MGIFDFWQNRPQPNNGIKKVVVRKKVKPQIVVRDDFWEPFEVAEWSLNKMEDDTNWMF